MKMSASVSNMVDPEVQVMKPESDKKLYRYRTLPNGIRALLISDPTIGSDPGEL